MALTPNLHRQQSGEPISARTLREVAERTTLASRDTRTRTVGQVLSQPAPSGSTFWAWLTAEYGTYMPHRYAFEEVESDSALLWRAKAGGRSTISETEGYAVELLGRNYAAETSTPPGQAFRSPVLMSEGKDLSGNKQYVFVQPFRRMHRVATNPNQQESLLAGDNYLRATISGGARRPITYPDGTFGLLLESGIPNTVATNGFYTLGSTAYRVFFYHWVVSATVRILIQPLSGAGYSISGLFYLQFRTQAWDPQTSTWGAWGAWTGPQNPFSAAYHRVLDQLSVSTGTVSANKVLIYTFEQTFGVPALTRTEVRMFGQGVAFANIAPTYFLEMKAEELSQ